MHYLLYDFSNIKHYKMLELAELDQEQISSVVSHKKDFFRLHRATYQEQQQHSKIIDDLYGFNIEKVEGLLGSKLGPTYHDYEIWPGLAPEQLQTPYDELRRVLHDCQFRDGDKLVDLGAGYGRAGVIIGERFPSSEFIGIEVACERVKEGNRIFSEFSFAGCELRAEEAHSSKTVIEPAKVYFLYDFGLPSQIEATLSKIVRRAFSEEFYVVARGRGVRSLINYKFPQLWSAFTPHHGETYSIYSTFCDVKVSERLP